MSAPKPNDIRVSGTVMVTLSLVRECDKHDARKKRIYTFPLDFSCHGSAPLMARLPDELDLLAGQVLYKIQQWEGRAKSQED